MSDRLSLSWREKARERLKRPVPPGVIRGAYPERWDPDKGGVERALENSVTPLARRFAVARLPREALPLAVAAASAGLEELSGDELRRRATNLGFTLREKGFALDPVSETFAVVREAARRVLGTPHYDVQLLGGWVLLQGMVAEMQTGEGKTLTASLAASATALAGVPAHVVTVNDYLARRDVESLTPLYEALGLSVGLVAEGMSPEERRAGYACDVTYSTNKDVAFDYLKDRISLRGGRSRIRLQLEALQGRGRSDALLHRGLHFVIVDEADSVLIDEARTPLLISGHGDDADEKRLYEQAANLAEGLEPGVHYEADVRERAIRMTDAGREALATSAQELGGVWSARRWREGLVEQALTAQRIFERDRDYLIREGKVQIIDEYTGRVMSDRTWEQGLHQAVEFKEGVELSGRQTTLARISTQRFFRRYLHLAGMTGTASEEANELWSTYGLAVVPIPPNKPCQRLDLGERILSTSDARWDAVVERVEAVSTSGRPVLVGTRSLSASEEVSARLERAGIPHTILNARQDADEASVVAQAGEAGRVTVATNMAGRGTDIPLGPGVAALGGLHVIVTERHDSRRIDRQLIGRCARQGEPGSVESLISLEDDLVRSHGGSLARWLNRRSPGGVSPELAGRVMDFSQRRARRLHARVRKAVMEGDRQLDRVLAFAGPIE